MSKKYNNYSTIVSSDKTIAVSRLRPLCLTHDEYLCWAKFDRNLGCYACWVLSPLWHICKKIWRHPQNR